MRIFLDTANLDDIRDHLGMIDGVTTNPTLVARESCDLEGHIRRIMSIARSRTIMAEVVAEDTLGMVAEGRTLAALGPEIMVKIPATREGIAATRILSREKIPVTVTLVFSPLQALCAAAAGAKAVALFVGRLDDTGADGAAILQQTADALLRHEYRTQIIAASLRSAERTLACALAGAHILTLPTKVVDTLLDHPLTCAGLEKFRTDWQRAIGAGVRRA